MSRWLVLTAIVLVFVLSLIRPGRVLAQDDLLDHDRAMARARFEAEQATLTELAQQRVAAVRTAYEETFTKYRFGRTPPSAASEALLSLQEAELALKGDAAVGPVLEVAWRHAWITEDMAQSKLKIGR